jgi:predicted DNA-binding transcriptional regulator YafY
MQVERQWKLLRLVPDRRNRRSTDELWNILRREVEYDDVSKRTVERDLAFLQTMFPIEQRTEGRTNYWYWQPNVNMWLPGMTDDEALAFHMVERNMRDILPEVSVDRLSAYFESARNKLTGNAKGVRPWTNKFRIVSSGIPRVGRKLFIGEASRIVRQALLDDRQLAVNYFNAEENDDPKNTLTTSCVLLNPLGIVQRDRELFLVYTLRGEVTPKFMALRDIESASASANQFEGPTDFDIDKYLESGALSTSIDMPIRSGLWIRLSISIDRSEWKKLSNSPLVASEKISQDTNGRTRLVMPIRFTAELLDWLLGLGPKVIVHHPAEIRHWIAQKTREAADQYRGHLDGETPQHVFRWFEKWREEKLTCKTCQWVGHAHLNETEPDDSIGRTEIEFRCPNCSSLILTVDYSATTDEIVAHWDVLDLSTRNAFLSTPERMDRFESNKLKSIKDLPDLKKGPDFLTWNLVEHKGGDVSNTIRHGAKFLWIQPALWEGVDEFLRVAELLRLRYGRSIRGIRISPQAMGFLGKMDAYTQTKVELACQIEIALGPEQ